MRFKIFVYALILFFCLLAAPVWAVQSHGGAEGLVSHQLAHLLFIVGVFFLLVHLVRLKFGGQGWRQFYLFLTLIIFWNVLTFSGHWLNEYVGRGKLIKHSGQPIAFVPEGFLDYFYYLSRMDHLLLVPAFAFLLIALKKWKASS